MPCSGPPLRDTVSDARPDSPPSAATAQVTAARQAAGPQPTPSAGAARSMPTGSTRQADQLPAASPTRVRNACAPAVATTTLEPVCAKPSSVHCSWVTPDVASVPETVVLKLLGSQAAGTGVVLTGGVPSTLTVCV